MKRPWGALGSRFREIPARLERAVERHLRPRILHLRTEHVAGPRTVEYAEDEALLICVVRNGAPHLHGFLEHHFRLGVRHVVFLDNGSTDDTVEIAKGYPNVTVLRTRCPYARYENVMKRYLARRFSRGRWNLCVDIDERFDYPDSDVVDLRSLLRYLNRHRYTALVAQMLDMFPDCRLRELRGMPEAPLREAHAFYDISNIRKTEYLWGAISNPAIRMHWDGIRNTVFGTEQGLTKAPLVRMDDEVEPFVHWHHARGARVADFSAVLFHYPFADAFYAKVRDAVETNRYGGFSVKDYGRYWEMLQRDPELGLRKQTSREFRDVSALIDEGFLITSPAFEAWTAESRRAVAGRKAGDASRA